MSRLPGPHHPPIHDERPPLTHAPGTRARSTLLTLATAVALALVGLVSPAQAADALTITGRIVFPSGYTYSADQPPKLEVHVPNGVGGSTTFWRATVGRVAADGSFTISKLEADKTYALLLLDGQRRLVAGYLTPGGGTSVLADGAAWLAPGTSGVEFRAQLGVQVTGRLELPAGVPDSAWSGITVSAVVGHPGSGAEREIEAAILERGSFVIGGLPAGQALRLQVVDSWNTIFGGGWNRDDGTFDKAVEKVPTLTAPATGVVLRPNLTGSIEGRIHAPDVSFAATRIGVYAVRDASNWIEATGDTDAQGRFVIANLDSGRSYALALREGWGEVQHGMLAPDGTLLTLPIPEDGPLGAVWDEARKVRPGETGVVLRPTVTRAVRGKVTAPTGFVFTPDGPASARITVHRRNGRTGEWEASANPLFVKADGTFSLQNVEEGKEYLLWYEPHPDAATVGAPTHAGFWTGNGTPLSRDVADARPAQVSTSRDVHFPLPVTNVTAPSVTGTVRVGSAVKVAVGTWEPSSVTTSVQWLRDGAAISGATSATYTPKPADEGKKLSVRVTAKGGTGWLPATVTSAAVTVAPAPIANVTRVSVSGTVAYGKTVWVKRGEWSPAAVSTSVQWLRDGAAISGATGSSYKVGKSDVGRKISVRVTAKGADGSTSRSTSVATKVPKSTPTVRVSVPSVKAGAALKATVTVDSGGLVTKPLGTVAVTIGSKTVKVTLTAKYAGKITVTLPAQAKGSHKVTAKYSPTTTSTTYLNGATSSAVTVKVT